MKLKKYYGLITILVCLLACGCSQNAVEASSSMEEVVAESSQTESVQPDEETEIEETIILEEQASEEDNQIALNDAEQQTDTQDEEPTEATTSTPEPVVAVVTEEVVEEPVAYTAPSSVLNAGTVFEGFSVQVNNTTTLATYSGGQDWPITTFYFFSASGEKLGSITGSAADQIVAKYHIKTATQGNIPPDGIEGWDRWFTKEFNSFRGLSGSTSSPTTPSQNDETTSSNGTAEFDYYANALEVIELTNEQREKNGLNSLKMDSYLMELAQTRAYEVSIKYSHERPDGTRVVHLGYGENVGGRASASLQVNAWMNSDGHRTNILLERYNYIGVGCYKADDGITYWVQIFSK